MSLLFQAQQLNNQSLTLLNQINNKEIDPSIATSQLLQLMKINQEIQEQVNNLKAFNQMTNELEGKVNKLPNLISTCHLKDPNLNWKWHELEELHLLNGQPTGGTLEFFPKTDSDKKTEEKDSHGANVSIQTHPWVCSCYCEIYFRDLTSRMKKDMYNDTLIKKHIRCCYDSEDAFQDPIRVSSVEDLNEILQATYKIILAEKERNLKIANSPWKSRDQVQTLIKTLKIK